MNATSNIMNTSSSKKHYSVLDGLRGIAAIMIVFFHFMEIVITDFSKNILAHGYLAVDFFFCLSGFVIAYAYDDRMQNMSIKTFFKQRLKRLHPLVVLGAFLGLITFLVDPFSDASTKYSFIQIVLLFLTSAFLIPYPVMEDRYFNNFGLNAPSWSLFWEYIANIFYALVLVKLPKKFLPYLLIVAAILLCYIAKTSGSLVGGWNGETFWHGGARMLFSFLAGLCIFRFQWIIKNKLGFWGLSALLTLAFVTPYNVDYNWIVEPFLIIIYFPLLISLGAGSIISKSQEKICDFSGSMSYPLYITHYCIMFAFGSYYSQEKPSNETLIPIIIGLIVIQLLVAYLAMRFYDRPMKKFLSKF